MRNQWYADHRDVVKWGALLQLASARELQSILQIAFLTDDEPPIVIASELGQATVDARVLSHFRDVSRICALPGDRGPKVQVFADPFVARSRKAYIDAALAAVRATAPRPAAVFLDPDTGIAEKPASLKHVTPAEVHAFWSVLLPGDWLVLYQHAARDAGWLDARRALFRGAVASAEVLTFASPNGARDVAFFAAARTSDPEDRGGHHDGAGLEA